MRVCLCYDGCLCVMGGVVDVVDDRCVLSCRFCSLRRMMRHLGSRLPAICWLQTSGIGLHDMMIVYSW